MVEESGIKLSKELAEIIDKYRESLSREEFIDLCVRTFLKESSVPEAVVQKRPAIEGEDKEREPVTEPVKKEVKKVAEERKSHAPTIAIQQVPVIEPRPERTRQVTVEHKKPSEFPGAKYINDTKFLTLWLLAIGFYGLGDVVTTHYALQLGLIEANPIAAAFKNIVNMALFKVATIIATFLISYTVFNTKTLIFSAPVMMLIAGIALTLNNILKIMHVLS